MTPQICWDVSSVCLSVAYVHFLWIHSNAFTPKLNMRLEDHLKICYIVTHPTQKKELSKFSRDPSRFVFLCQWVTCTRSWTLLSSQFGAVTLPACCVQIAESCSSVSSWLQRGHDVLWKKKKWNLLERITRRLFTDISPLREQSTKAPPLMVKFFSAKSRGAIVQPCISPRWRQECGLAAHECFMTVSAGCCVTGWCGKPWCVTVAIINLGLSARGQGRRDRTGNRLFQDPLGFSWCSGRTLVHTSRHFNENLTARRELLPGDNSKYMFLTQVMHVVPFWLWTETKGQTAWDHFKICQEEVKEFSSSFPFRWSAEVET